MTNDDSDLPSLTPNELDVLMGKDPLKLERPDLRQIVAYHRKQREKRMSGEKPEKATASPALAELLGKLTSPPPKNPINRRA